MVTSLLGRWERHSEKGVEKFWCGGVVSYESATG